MSIVVWDGQSLVVDRGATDGVTMWELDKAWEHGDETITGTGAYSTIVLLRDWYLAGAVPDLFPRTLVVADLLIASPAGLRRYDNTSPVPIDHRYNKCAFGSGRDFAYGALAMGATAEQAAQVACKYSVTCGHGVQVFKIR